MISGHENLTPDQVRDELMTMEQDGSAEAFSNLLGCVILLCNHIGDLQHDLKEATSKEVVSEDFTEKPIETICERKQA